MNPFIRPASDSRCKPGCKYHGTSMDCDLCKPEMFAASQPVGGAPVARQEAPNGWHEAVQRVADESDFEREIIESIFAELLPHFLRDKEEAGYVTLRLDDLIAGDSYGVYGSDFYRCRVCDGQSGAGVLNKGIQHDGNCPLAALSAPVATQSADAVDASKLWETIKILGLSNDRLALQAIRAALSQSAAAAKEAK